jgi:hypothetical protein
VQAEVCEFHTTVFFGLNIPEHACSECSHIPAISGFLCVLRCATRAHTSRHLACDGAIQSAGKRAWPWPLIYLKCTAIGQRSEPVSEPASAHNDMLCGGGECKLSGTTVHVHLSNAITRIDDTHQPQPIASCSASTIRCAQLTLCLILPARRSIDQVWNEDGMMLASTARQRANNKQRAYE